MSAKTDRDTIAAISTPSGRGGIGIVRVSGTKAKAIAQSVIKRDLPDHQATYTKFYSADKMIIDHGIALFFSGPNSFTGEDVLELQGHGGPVVMDLLLACIIEAGARLARPGEFSERAFLNDRMDLAQAEAVADLIDSTSAQAARAAVRSLEGEFSSQVNALDERIIELRLYVEAALDFPEEEIDFLSVERVTTQLRACLEETDKLLASVKQGCLLKEGMCVVIIGRPNVGKSSLLNRLAQREAAIVTDIPGTTRDVVREHIHLDGMPLHVIDTAGLRSEADTVEQEGIRRAWNEIAGADQVLLMIDDQIGFEQPEQDIVDRIPECVGVTRVHNKVDLTKNTFGSDEDDSGTVINLSAKTGDGVDALTDHLKTIMGHKSGEEGLFIARRRHLEAIEQSRNYLATGLEQLNDHRAGELLAEDLRRAHQTLSTITGEFVADDLLGRIFSGFCIGK